MRISNQNEDFADSYRRLLGGAVAYLVVYSASSFLLAQSWYVLNLDLQNWSGVLFLVQRIDLLPPPLASWQVSGRLLYATGFLQDLYCRLHALCQLGMQAILSSFTLLLWMHRRSLERFYQEERATRLPIGLPPSSQILVWHRISGAYSIFVRPIVGMPYLFDANLEIMNTGLIEIHIPN